MKEPREALYFFLFHFFFYKFAILYRERFNVYVAFTMLLALTSVVKKKKGLVELAMLLQGLNVEKFFDIYIELNFLIAIDSE